MKKSFYKNLFSLEGKTALVTGGAGILGKHLCSALADFGAQIAVVDVQSNAAEDLAAGLTNEFKVKSFGFGCDVSNPDSVKSMVKDVESKLGPVHILLNNAAAKSKDLKNFFAPFEKFSLEEWRAINSVNIDGMFLVAQAVGQAMVDKKIKGSIIQTSSIYGSVAPDQRIYEGSEYMGMAINTPAVYSTSKAGVIGLTKYLATYWGHHGIRVNTLIPGGVESGQNETFKKNYSARIPLGKMAEPEDMTGAVVYLASDASKYVTGTSLIVDGGLHAW